MIRNDINDISDEVFNSIVMPCTEVIQGYVKNNFLNEYVAFNIATSFNMDAMWNASLDVQINSAIEDLIQICFEDCDKEKIKCILKDKHHLEIVSEDPIKIEKFKRKW